MAAMARRTIEVDDEDELEAETPSWRERLQQWMLRHPKDTVALFAAIGAVAAITVNALWLQTGPHPAPLFALRPVTARSFHRPPSNEVVPRPRPTKANFIEGPAAPRSRADLVGDIQTELAKRGFYNGAVDGVYGPKTDAAVRDFAQAAKFRADAEPTEALLQKIVHSGIRVVRVAPPASMSRKHDDPIADLLGPSSRLLAVQRALSEFGYGQISPTGVMGPETAAAIEKFERSREMPVTGQMSDRLVRELAVVTGRPLE
jgi:hypothetical protein